ncbi:threonine aspartase 1 isoform X7 [Chelonia mydas]|uniref:threonine aspartase 1 isoform X7 n=1 Tax=Chelonia mydas TaxID=8469 RepID=UPI001CA835E6|nr:threonine aspartase 1 isoform X7 [Chelonia mydas]
MQQLWFQGLLQAIEKLQAGALATDAVTAALIELEDSPFTNAGMGSNLNLLGEIECDASIMDGKSLNFGAVGALSGIKNPVSVANRLLCEGQKGKLSAGRIPPCFLVGEGAYRWAVDHGIPACSPGIMTTRFSLAAFKRNKRKLELAEKVETDLIQLKKRRQSSEKENDSGTLDTVGAVVVDQEGNVAAAVSSGGLALKHPGRVGQAALYGCGCWAENIGVHNPYSTAVSTSGCGEHLVRTILARECSRALQTEDAHQALLETMQNKFISSPFLANEDGVLGGVIVLRSCRCSAEPDSLQEKQTLLVEFLWSHTTESMCVGYMSAQDGKAKDLPKERLTPENPSDRFQPRALKEVSVICHAGETVAASHTKPCGGSFKSWPAQHCSAVCLELVTKPPQSPPQADSEVSGATPQARCRLT